jgi:carbamoyl-phosphate synthase large subunit
MKRTDIKSILIIGSGPIVIGQACEFDYSGTQSCKVLREEGYRVILVNSNPATIMTDTDLADATYVEPLTVEAVTRVIEKERPDALLPTLGGQTALNVGIGLFEAGVLDKYNVEMLGASPDAIKMAEERELFKVAMEAVGLETAKSALAHSLEESLEKIDEIGYPVIIRPSYILGGKGTGFANNKEELINIAKNGLDASPVSQILIEESIKGWKEYELEVMRDHKDQAVIVCSIENFDAMGVHTGDSITVAPAQTLTDKEYQKMRDAAFLCLRTIGVETGGSNVQFAVDPKTGRQIIIEMNPRVSRSSALASKATGFPIAKIAAKLAVGYSLDEISNDITKKTPASFEPSIDYVVTKIPRWAFEKLPGAKPELGSQMQSVGEVMALGRTFIQSLQKAIRSCETGRFGLNADELESEFNNYSDDELINLAKVPTPDRLFVLERLLHREFTVDEVHKISGIDPWFLFQIKFMVDFRKSDLDGKSLEQLDDQTLTLAKSLGFSNVQLAYLSESSETDVENKLHSLGVNPVYKTVDTCAGEFEAYTPYFYSTYGDENEISPATDTKKIVILGSGPNRIGQGVEFDYCCVQAAMAISDLPGYESVMINCNPETVSTDYDTSDYLFFEPITREDVVNVLKQVRPDGIIVSLGGQTPLKLAQYLQDSGYKVLGTSPENIDMAEDRESFSQLCEKNDIKQPKGDMASSYEQAQEIAKSIGFPLLVRPSYVLGGRAMTIVRSEKELESAFAELELALAKEGGITRARPVLLDSFLDNAVEVDVDSLRDSKGEVFIAGIMQHIEQAGVHSGDSACVLPPQSLSEVVLKSIEAITKKVAKELDVLGCLNIQFGVLDEEVYMIEANPRASRTVPFVGKVTGSKVAYASTMIMLGKSIEELIEEGVLVTKKLNHVGVKEAVMPFSRFPDVDVILGPEMRSTGEAIGIDKNFSLAFVKSQIAAGTDIPMSGTVFISVSDKHKEKVVAMCYQLHLTGYQIAATEGTKKILEDNNIPVKHYVNKLGEDVGENAVDLIANSKIDLVINTPREFGTHSDGDHIRKACTKFGITCITTIEAAVAAINGVIKAKDETFATLSLQEYERL